MMKWAKYGTCMCSRKQKTENQTKQYINSLISVRLVYTVHILIANVLIYNKSMVTKNIVCIHLSYLSRSLINTRPLKGDRQIPGDSLQMTLYSCHNYTVTMQITGAIVSTRSCSLGWPYVY